MYVYTCKSDSDIIILCCMLSRTEYRFSFRTNREGEERAARPREGRGAESGESAKPCG